MGWLPSWLGGDQGPLADLDPALREFLKNESPEKYRTVAEQHPAEPSKSYRAQLGLDKLTNPDPSRPQPEHQDSADEERLLPSASLFQDGRYKHLWKDYRPIGEVEEAGKSDQEKLTDIVGGFKDRTASVTRAAMENCSNEQMSVHECFRTGSWSARLTLCKAESRALNRCLTMQGKFMRALGYLSMYARSEEEAERIQMHADRLYHRMLAEEETMKEAKESLTDNDKIARTLATERFDLPEVGGVAAVNAKHGAELWESMPAALKAQLEDNHFKDLQGFELEVAKQELFQNLAFNHQFSHSLQDRVKTEYKERVRRQEEGGQRFGDRIKSMFDLRDYSEIEKELARQKQGKEKDTQQSG